MSFLKRVFRRRVRQQKIVCNDECITKIVPNGEKETVRWADIDEVGVIVAGGESFSEDIFWVLLGENVSCGIPSSAEGISELIPHLRQLPDFNDEMLVRAMSATEDVKFVCWRRQNSKKVTS